MNAYKETQEQLRDRLAKVEEIAMHKIETALITEADRLKVGELTDKIKTLTEEISTLKTDFKEEYNFVKKKLSDLQENTKNKTDKINLLEHL